MRLRRSWRKLDLLILDELGYVPASKAGAELLFDVISTAYERTSLIVTTNLPFENWTEVLGSERLTGAALDRLTHRCHILETNGESYRLQDAPSAAGARRLRCRLQPLTQDRAKDNLKDPEPLRFSTGPAWYVFPAAVTIGKEAVDRLVEVPGRR